MKFNTPTLPGSWMPNQAPPAPPVMMSPLVVGQPPAVRHPNEVTTLGPLEYPFPESFDQIFERAGGSAAGFHAVSTALSCPRKKLLQTMGVKRRGENELIDSYTGKLEKRSLGTLIHCLLAVRVVYGQAATEALLVRPNGTATPDFGPVGAGMGMEDLGKVLTILRMYNLEHPLQLEPFNYLTIEGEVATDIGDGLGGSCLRTAIYDAVVVRHDQPGVVWSLEKKTASRAGSGVMDQYMPQFATQCVVWNANPALVAKYGPMAGVIPDVIVKTVTPKCERHLPRYISRFMQHLTVTYLRLPDQMRYPTAPDGALVYPAMLHNCWGKFDPCQFVDLCWYNSHGEYRWPDEKSW